MASQQRISTRYFSGFFWRFENLQCGRWEAWATVLIESLLPQRISDSVNPSDSYLEPPTSATPPTTSTSSSSTSTSVPAFVSHTSLFSTVCSGLPTGLSLPPSPNSFLFRGINGKRGTAASLTVTTTTDSVSGLDELMSSSRITLFFDIDQVQFGRTWLLHGDYYFFYLRSSWLSYFNLINLSASMPEMDVIMIFQGHIEERNSKVPHSHFLFFVMFKCHQLQIHRQLLDFITSKATTGTSKRFSLNESCWLSSLFVLSHRFEKSFHQLQ